MAARIERIQFHDPIGPGKGRVRLRFVARFPVVDMVVLLTLFLIADQGRARLERLLRGDDRRQHVVVDLDQRGGVDGDVRIGRDHTGDLLTLEAHFIGGQHRLGVA